MKRSIYLILISILYSCGILYANNTEIPLTSSSSIPYPRSKAINEVSVTATTDGEELAIYFSSSVNVAAITLTNETGEIIYQETVNTNAALSFYIPVGGLDSGNYTLTVQYGDISLSGHLIL